MQQVLQAACCTPGRFKPQVVLVGATLGPSIESSALQMVCAPGACCAVGRCHAAFQESLPVPAVAGLLVWEGVG